MCSSCPRPVAPTLNYKWVSYNRCCGKLGEPSISSWRVMSIRSGNAQGGKIARGLLWSVLLEKSEGRLGELWEIMDRYDGRIRMQCDLRLTELLQTYGRCVHFGGMDGTGRLGKSLTTSLRRNARSSRHRFTVSVAFKAEEDNDNIKQGKNACAGWKLRHAEEIKHFRRDVAPEEGVKKGGGQKID